MHRFYLENIALGKDDLIIELDDFVHQAFHVLRFKAGETVILFNGNMIEYEYKIDFLNKKIVQLKLVNFLDNFCEPTVKLRLYMALLKNMDKFEFVLQKCTELGVSEFYPLISQRTERTNFGKMERFGKILKEATEQCGGGIPPKIFDPVNLSDEFEKDRCGFMPYLAHLNGEKLDFKKKSGLLKVDLFIGPEGGFSDAEYELAKNSKFQIFKLGNRTLRAETAAICFSSIFVL